MGESLGPTTHSQRILSLDVLRGFAVLGILIMNIQSFSMVGSAYFNPTSYGDLTGLNWGVWFLSHLLADMKFMTIFSILFGAGIVLMGERMEEKRKKAAPLHYRRMTLLLLFGLAHGWLLWVGDILVTYALCGMGVFLFRKRSPRTLLILGLLSASVASAISFMTQWSIQFWPPEAFAGMMEIWSPTQAQIVAELDAMRGGWSAQMAHRIPNIIAMESYVFLTNMSWRAGGMMLVGMALYKMGVLSGKLSAGAYRGMVVAGLLLGLPLILGGVWFQRSTGWMLETGFFGGIQFNYWGSVPIALAWIGLVMLFCKARPGTGSFNALAATGQMAFTNYILQTVICTSLFYGHGLGLFGNVDRTSQILMVFCIWLLQLGFSQLWMSRFRFGPLEWAWRCLSYMKIQPLRKAI